MSPDEARPEMRMIYIYGGIQELEPGEAFFLYCGWAFLPRNIAWDNETCEEVTPHYNIQDRTDWAHCHYEVTMDDSPLETTSDIEFTCRWYRFFQDGCWLVVPIWKQHDYYIEFPLGLSTGTYKIVLDGQVVDGGPSFQATTYLIVE